MIFLNIDDAVIHSRRNSIHKMFFRQSLKLKTKESVLRLELYSDKFTSINESIINCAAPNFKELIQGVEFEIDLRKLQKLIFCPEN